MLRRLLSLTLPVMLSAVAALSFLHLRREGLLAAPAPLQVAQADPTDPVAPPPAAPVDPVVPPMAEAAPVDPTKPPVPAAPQKARPKRVRRAVPTKDDEVRTPFLRSLLGQLDSFTEVSDEDRDGVRKMLYDADVELSDSMGPAARMKIEAANRKRGFVVGPSAPRTATGPTIKRKDVLRPADPVAPGEVPPVRPVDPVPPPKKDVFDDLFKN